MFAHLEPITVLYDLQLAEFSCKSDTKQYECRTYLTVVVGFKLRYLSKTV